MNTKEKAIEITDKFKPHVQGWDCYFDCPRNPDDILADAKQCALIVTGEMLKIEYVVGISLDETASFVKYWQEVKIEIEKL